MNIMSEVLIRALNDFPTLFLLMVLLVIGFEKLVLLKLLVGKKLF